MKRSYALPETSKLIRGIHVGEQRRVNLDLPRLELVERLVQGERAGGEAALECGQGRLPERGWERPRLGDGGVGAGLRQLAQQTGRDERRVDGEHDRELRGRGPQARDDPGQRRTGLRAVVDELERQLEPVRPLADRELLVADLAEPAPGTFGQRLGPA